MVGTILVNHTSSSKVTEPKVTEPKVTTPKVTTPKVTTRTKSFEEFKEYIKNKTGVIIDED